MPRQESTFSYILEVVDWEFRYSLGLQFLKNESDPFWESDHLAIECKILLPDHIKAKTAIIDIWTMDELEKDFRTKLKPRGFGWISLAKGRLEVAFHVPTSKLQPLMTAVSAGKLRYFDLTGTRVYRNRADISRFSVWRDMDRETLEEVRDQWANAGQPKNRVNKKDSQKNVSTEAPMDNSKG